MISPITEVISDKEINEPLVDSTFFPTKERPSIASPVICDASTNNFLFNFMDADFTANPDENVTVDPAVRPGLGVDEVLPTIINKSRGSVPKISDAICANTVTLPSPTSIIPTETS